ERRLGAVELKPGLLDLARGHVALLVQRLRPVELRERPGSLRLVALKGETLVPVVDNEKRVSLLDALSLHDADLEDVAVGLRDQLRFPLGLQVGGERGSTLGGRKRGGNADARHGAPKGGRVGARRRFGRGTGTAGPEQADRE